MIRAEEDESPARVGEPQSLETVGCHVLGKFRTALQNTLTMLIFINQHSHIVPRSSP